LLLVVEVLLSHSRAGMAILGLLALVLLAMVARRRPWIAVIVVVLVAIALTWMPSMYWVRFASIGQLGGIVVDRSLLLRTHLLQGAWQTFMDHFWIGVGLGNFRNQAPTFILGSWVAHNGFLEVGATLGIMGLVSYVVMLASGANMAWRAAKPLGARGVAVDQGLALGIFLALGAFSLSIMTLSSHFHVLLWILLGLANAIRRCAGRGTSHP
jgi:O-antigen ligase